MKRVNDEGVINFAKLFGKCASLKVLDEVITEYECFEYNKLMILY